QPQAFILLRARHRKQYFNAARDLARAAEHVAVGVLLPERERLVAAHRSRAAGVEILEERHWLAAQAMDIAHVRAQRQGHRAAERVEKLLVGNGAVELQVARRNFERD